MEWCLESLNMKFAQVHTVFTQGNCLRFLKRLPVIPVPFFISFNFHVAYIFISYFLSITFLLFVHFFPFCIPYFFISFSGLPTYFPIVVDRAVPISGISNAAGVPRGPRGGPARNPAGPPPCSPTQRPARGSTTSPAWVLQASPSDPVPQEGEEGSPSPRRVRAGRARDGPQECEPGVPGQGPPWEGGFTTTIGRAQDRCECPPGV